MFEFVKAVKNMSLQKLKRTPTDTGEGKTFRAKPLKLSVVIKMFTRYMRFHKNKLLFMTSACAMRSDWWSGFEMVSLSSKNFS